MTTLFVSNDSYEDHSQIIARLRSFEPLGPSILDLSIIAMVDREHRRVDLVAIIFTSIL